ncbi:DUF11 domain-containing protein [Sphingomonas sp. IC-56]|uniref:DUF11 domain-containing protein n=1 Tax=Sphingomonas sp. IC-56 TaxID=2898529 RepID=UPI001E50FF68|nr:DUF11 domain-containing protein [Sphingomonas sp. IC-56]MCD2324384.1 DUF11 domain-containing protein [Sphingomonas sp. IC-56]
MRMSLLLVGLVAAAPAIAGPVEIQSTVLAEKRAAAADGTTRVSLVPAGRVTPGDRVVYQIEYRNNGKQAAGGLVIANPVPAAMQYVSPAEGSLAPELSVDGTTFGPLSTLKVRDRGAVRPAVAADVRVVRWRIAQPVAPGARGSVAFRAVLK